LHYRNYPKLNRDPLATRLQGALSNDLNEGGRVL
jgi:hypothetical protein